MKTKKIVSTAALIGASLSAAHGQTTISGWNFDLYGTQAAPFNSPASNLGSVAGTATVLGMVNNYNDGTSASLAPFADNLATAGASTGAGSYGWRIRGGNTVAGTPNGWSTNAPIASQGVEFAASTASFNSIQVSFDLYTTGAAEANVALLYTLNGGSTWTDATLTYSGSMSTASQVNSSSSQTITGPYLQLKQSAGGWYNGITASLTGITGANNNPNFGIEIVNASTGTDNINQSGTVYNNSSGNWRFDNVLISGIATVPEPSSLALGGLGLAVIGLFRRNRKA
jgi:hypothetical protein